MSDPTPPLIVLISATPEEAPALARVLVEEKLAACVNVLPVTSTYRWKAQVQCADETLLLVKTTGDRIDDLERRVQALHSYDVPEFVVLKPQAVSDTYLEWLLESCRLA